MISLLLPSILAGSIVQSSASPLPPRGLQSTCLAKVQFIKLQSTKFQEIGIFKSLPSMPRAVMWPLAETLPNPSLTNPTRPLSPLTVMPIPIHSRPLVRAKRGGRTDGVGIPTFDWSIAESLQSMGLPVITAGGLTPENVPDAVMTVRPWRIDVAGGVEAKPGRKDLEKVSKFVGGARKAAVEANKGF
ncbi:hypothetical protein HJC23_006090 [Cyclotella cryptica]|uniref:phosphoribosylanthranilate isomerase n=1 Tax=Cyclotella cryptica TaxID=29204 RepID=A0ABD3QJG0_9STRA|eukprot:CCRYP_004544-RA/>CCRYP_004544-RA protein AED:0.41 eAED:0.41 QI:0/0/0/1/0/0/2/0/187